MTQRIGRDQAFRIAQRHLSSDSGATVSDVVEIETGWFVPYRSKSDMPAAGSRGVIVNKADGAVFGLGSAFSVERDLTFYDKGYQSAVVDLVITEVLDRQRAIDILSGIGPRTVELSYESETVWRIPRQLTRNEIATRLDELPCIFGDLRIYFSFEQLALAEDDDVFRFRILPRQQHTD